jgi:hypothetical protein
VLGALSEARLRGVEALRFVNNDRGADEGEGADRDVLARRGAAPSLPP